MKRLASASQFRAFARLQDAVARAAMPRTSAADPAAPAELASLPPARRVFRAPAALTFTLGEAARA